MKTSELTGAALDWAVAKAEGATFRMHTYAGIKPGKPFPVVEWEDWVALVDYSPSTDWNLGGPIIERERLCARPLKNVWGCWVTDHAGDIHALGVSAYGPTPLIAAMRCYVASKLGDEVELPEELK